MKESVWQELERLYQKFQKLGINEAVDYEKYYQEESGHRTVIIPAFSLKIERLEVSQKKGVGFMF